MSNLADILERRLRPASIRWLRSMAKVCRDRERSFSLVGGVVRDILLQRPINDLDVSVAGLDEQLATDLANAVEGLLTARSQFNTFKIEVDSFTIDTAMTRQESYSHPGALPDVRSGSVDEDLARRDFSVNAMAIDLSSGHWGDLLDPMGGQADLERRLIRVLHPVSFDDDATRIFRAVRYSQRLGFALEDDTAGLLQTSLGQLGAISGDRLRHEFERGFEEEHPGAILGRLNELGVLEAVFSPLGRRTGAWPDELNAADEPRELVWLAYLACGLSPVESARLAQRLNLDSDGSVAVQDAAKAEAALAELDSHNRSRSEIYRAIFPFHPAALLAVSAAHKPSAASRSIDLYLGELRFVTAELTGRDIMALGIAEGPEVGRLLETLLDARLDGDVTDRQGEEDLVVRNTSLG